MRRDVYKRQGAALLSMSFGSTQVPFSEILTALMGGETQAYNIVVYARLPRTLAALLCGSAPVSYTHLDVYKRQEQWRLGGGEGLGQQQAGLIGLIVGSGFHGGLLSERAGPGPGGRCLFSIVDAFSGLGKSWGWEMKRERCHTKNNNCHTKERNP